MSEVCYIPVANPAATFAPYLAKIEAAAYRVIHSGRYVLGTEVEAFEAEFSAWLGAAHTVGVANGTDALELALRAVGVGPGDEVAPVANTVTATVSAVNRDFCNNGRSASPSLSNPLLASTCNV